MGKKKTANVQGANVVDDDFFFLFKTVNGDEAERKTTFPVRSREFNGKGKGRVERSRIKKKKQI